MFDATVELLKKYDKIAVYGMSATETKAAHKVPIYMSEQGYEIIGINPRVNEIEGRKVYPTLAEIEENIEILNVFRPATEAKAIVQEAIKRKNEKGDLKAVWLQLGIFDEEARNLAEANNIEYVENACMLVEHGKM